ncbi:MAG TPA: PIG-L family deacetylase, partial [Gemmatimonadaceae bacterium]
MMTSSALRAALCAAIVTGTVPLAAQLSPVPPSSSWHDELHGIGTTARVLIIGAHPDDEDNALIAWLSLGRHVETAYLSLTRGENGVNLNYREGQTLLGMVRTAEILAERKRDGAHQYFTRAYDFGRAKNDSAVYAAWPREPLVDDVVTVIRAFRPQVVISLFAGDTTVHDAQHQVAGAVARAAFMLAADAVRVPPVRTSLLGAWRVGAFYQLVDSGVAPSLRINVGEVDAERGRSYAEIGADIRLLQRTQPRLPAPRVGPVYRYLRRDSLRTGAERGSDTQISVSPSLFADADTGWARFASVSLADSVRAAIDSLMTLTHAPVSGSPLPARDEASQRLERIVRVSTRARNALGCGGVAAVGCRDALGDLALSLATVRDRATRALLDANAIVVDVTADREVVAVG